MLSKGLKDEEKEKISELFNSILDLEFDPDLWKNEQRQKLSDNLKQILDLTLDDVENPTLLKLKTKKFNLQKKLLSFMKLHNRKTKSFPSA